MTRASASDDSASPRDEPVDDRARRLAQLAAVVETSGDALVSVTLDGAILTWNPAAERMFGYTEAEAIGREITLIAPPNDTVRAAISEAVGREGRPFRARTERTRKDGGRVPIAITATPMRDENGRIFGISAVLRDITQVQRAEERQKLLLRELAHRGKNMLAIVQSIARHSLTPDRCAPEARDGFIERIAALARIYQTLNAEGFEGAKLSELARIELEPWMNRVDIEGPDVMMRASEAQTFGLALHELATNAARHGALSRDDGRVSIAWRIDEDGDEPIFAFDWVESGGPPVDPETRANFGMTVLTSVLEQALTTAPVVDFAPGGIRYGFRAPLANVGRRIEASPIRARIRCQGMRAVHDAWWREDGSLPGVEELDNVLAAHADLVSVVEIDMTSDPPPLRMLAMNKDLRQRGKRFDATLGDKSARDIPGTIEATYRRCARLGKPMYEFQMLPAEAGGETIVLERLYLPCARGGRITNVVGVSSYGDGA